MERTQGEQILVTYMAASTGRTQVYGSATKQYYGYRKRGDQFMAFRSDVAARPDLLQPVDYREVPNQVVGMRGRPKPQGPRPQSPIVKPVQQVAPTIPPQAPPPPPTPWAGEESVVAEVKGRTVDGLKLEIRTIDWEGRLNKGQIKTLYQNNVRTLGDAVAKGKTGLMAITGIGEKIADTVLQEAAQYSSG